MIAPTTREEYERVAAEQVLQRPWNELTEAEQEWAHKAALRLIAWQDTFSVVCPREPTDYMRTLASVVQFRPGKKMYHVLKSGIAASPFAPKEPTDGR